MTSFGSITLSFASGNLFLNLTTAEETTSSSLFDEETEQALDDAMELLEAEAELLNALGGLL